MDARCIEMCLLHNNDSVKIICVLRAQVTMVLLVPLNNTTPFCENRYQKIAALAEWCLFFCKILPKCKGLTENYINSCVLYGKITAFAYTIRAPPSEI